MREESGEGSRAHEGVNERASPRRRRQWGLGRNPSTAILRVADGIRTTRPSRSLAAIIWQPSRDLRGL